ncbi:MAG: hypothetical protein ACP5HD_01830 [Thermoproteus sp.]
MYRLIAVCSAVALSALLAPFAALVYYGYGLFSATSPSARASSDR